MRWSGNGNPALIDAIMESFRTSPDDCRRIFSKFRSADWERTEIWLDNSGLALYFLSRMRGAGMADAIDAETLRRLDQKRAGNRDRTADMMQEFVALNHAFRDAGMRYANIKGFTLTPVACPDLLLRRQSDFDLLIHPADLAAGRALLEERGYELVLTTARTIELKSGHSQKVSREAHYGATPIRSVELHTSLVSPSTIAAGEYDERLDRLTPWTCEAGSFPALSGADQLIGQALHLLGHFLSEHTRPSWLLEYRHHVLARQRDAGFWAQVQALASRNREATTALGISTLVARDLFGGFEAPELDPWTLDALPSGVRIWAERYGRRSLLAEVPGTKLYLFLDGVLNASEPKQQLRRHAIRLLPTQTPHRILRPPPNDTLRLRMRREFVQLRYLLYRTRFHLVQGVAYFIERRRWSRLLRREGRRNRAESAERQSITVTS